MRASRRGSARRGAAVIYGWEAQSRIEDGGAIEPVEKRLFN